MEGLVLSVGLAVVVIFLKIEVRRQRQEIERLKRAVCELNPGLNW